MQKISIQSLSNLSNTKHTSLRFAVVIFIGVIMLITESITHAQPSISNKFTSRSRQFPLVEIASVATIFYDERENVLIKRSAELLGSDIEKVTGRKPIVSATINDLKRNVVIVGTLHDSELINKLITSKKINIDPIRGKWESFIIQTVEKPIAGVDQALVIVGSDRRGAAFGVFSLSKEIGVSPWYWWADAPVTRKDELYVSKGRYVSPPPGVKYRGIFINDEAPALRNWAQEKFGGFNHHFYEKVYELILRNKGNFLWPAMWRPAAFADDDPDNARLADEYGIVISTSHHEPMMRAHDEWSRFNGGEWNYHTNKEQLQAFWRGGIERMGNYESVVTLGMRGDGDEAMSEDTATELLQRIIADQRAIIEDVTGKPTRETPQVWAIYKEVQDYYDKGLRVDDDILILLCDDNWGNIRIVPKKEDLIRKGGYGIYYHFDYVGGPVSYRWLNVTQIERVWEQMNLAYRWGAKDMWIVNVGDIKPMELPISFFLDFAWNPNAIRAHDLPDYYRKWAKEQFGDYHTEEIATILSLYTKYNARRTPEMLKPDTYSLTNYREADRIVEEYQSLVKRCRDVYDQLPPTHKDAFYQLVLSPVELCSNLNEMYVAAGKNNAYATQGRASANYYADKVKELFERDVQLTRDFHTTVANGKWNHMMSQTHIGYTNWNNPPVNKMPPVSYVQPRSGAALGYTVEHARGPAWLGGLYARALPPFDPINNQHYYIELFNQGDKPAGYTISTKDPWIKVSSERGDVRFEERVEVSIDWKLAPNENVIRELYIAGGGQTYTIQVPVIQTKTGALGYIENNGMISIDASLFTNKNEAKDIRWIVVPNMGRTSSAITCEPANAPQQIPGSTTPWLEYAFTTFHDADLKIESYLSPTLNFKKEEGLKFAIAIDDEKPHIINMHEGETAPDWEYPEWWNKSVGDHIKKKLSSHTRVKAGKHVLKIWMIDPGIVFQKFVIDTGGLLPSYLGPPTSVYIKP